MGRGTGAVTNVVLKSGTNTLSRRRLLESAEQRHPGPHLFQPRVGHIAYNQVGGNIGGPIKKNKLFSSPTT